MVKKEHIKYMSLYGFRVELCNPMSLCFLDGPEGGIGIAFGKKPKKFGGKVSPLGCTLKTWYVCLEP